MGGVSFLKRDEKREIWANRIDEFKASNLSQRAWCEEKGININTFRYWLKEAAVTCPTNPSDGFELASISIMKDSYCPEVTLEVKDIKLSITADYDEMLLLRLIKTLKKL